VPELRALFEDSCLMYGDALDTLGHAEKFLKLWRILECITLQSNDKIRMKEVVTRVGFLTIEQGPLYADLATALLKSRNRYVHRGSFTEAQGYDEVQHLRILVDVVLESALRWATHLTSKAQMSELFTVGPEPTAALLRRQQLISRVLRIRRESAPGAKRPLSS
jgi:hypothetical protein